MTIIMRFFICLILYICLLIKSSLSNYIQCTSHCLQLTVSFLEPLIIPIECQENTNANTSIYDDALICMIDYRIDYDAKHIYINFKASNNTNTFKENYTHSEFLMQAVWLGFNEESKQPNITHRTYACNTNNDCARQFYLKTIEYLIQSGQVELNKIHSELYNESLSMNKLVRRRCKDSSKTGNQSFVRCGNGLCYAHNINKEQYCTSDITPMLFSEMEYHLPISSTNEREVIQYKCNKNLCNRNATIEKIRKILHNYTNWNKSKKVEEKQEQQQVQEKSSAIHQTMSYYLLILSLFIRGFLL